ncbi:hypothetical protein EI94DRAFT_1801089 [Lactarius quietus]|nr:hypothetical protein EI94DRAFT_1801089 [Lactarius quietus]
MPPPKPPQELTQLEVQLLMTAARLLAATRMFSPCLPPHAQEAYLMNKVKEEIMSVANNFKKFMAEPNKNLKKPRVHPIIQRANEPDWHSDLSYLDLGPYMEGLQDHRRWWEVSLPALQDDEDVPMDPPASLPLPHPPAAPAKTAPPSTPAPEAPTHSSKGKARIIPPAGSSDPRSTLTALPTPNAPLLAPAPSTMPAVPYAFRVPRHYATNTETAQDDNDDIEDFNTTPRKGGSPPNVSLPQVHVDDASPPPPAQRHRIEVQPPVATGNDRCGGALPEEVQDTLNVSDDGGSSHHSPMSLHSPSGTPGEDLVSRVNSLEGKMDYVILVLNAIAGRQGIVPSSLPGYIQPPPPRRSPSPSTQSQSLPGIPISSLGISDPLTNTPSGSGSASDRSVHRGRGGASPASRRRGTSTGSSRMSSSSRPYYQVNQNIQHRGQHSPVMLSDPSDGSSSDAQSFDEDDMYGSDSGIQSISMKPHSKEEVTISNEVQMNEDQNTEISTQVQRMDISMGNVSIIMGALCEAEGIDISSIANPADNQAVTTSHMPSYLEGSSDGNEI